MTVNRLIPRSGRRRADHAEETEGERMNPPIPLVCDAPCMTSPARCWLRRSCLIRKRLLREARRILGTNTSASGIRSLSEVGARCNGSGNAARVPPHGESLARIPRSVDHDSPISLLKRTRVPVTSTHFLSATVRCIQERNSHGHVLERRHTQKVTQFITQMALLELKFPTVPSLL